MNFIKWTTPLFLFKFVAFGVNFAWQANPIINMFQRFSPHQLFI